MQATTLQDVINHIDSQLSLLGKTPFAIDEKIANAACDQFDQNYEGHWFNKHWFFKTSCARSLIERVTSNNHNSLLEKALQTQDNNESIRQFSLGGEIYGVIGPCDNTRTLIQWFTEQQRTKVVAYLAILQPDALTRAWMVTEALGFAQDTKTAQLLIDLGANLNINYRFLLSSCCKRRDVELLSFFVKAGVKLDAEITDYEKWQADCDELTLNGNNWSLDEVRHHINLHPNFKTPLEAFIAEPDISAKGEVREIPTTRDPTIVLDTICKAMDVDPSLYQKSSAEDLYHSLNQAGIRIRRQMAEDLFARLQIISSESI